MNAVIEHKTVDQVIDSYETAKKEIVAGYKLLDLAQARLNPHTRYFHVIENRYSSDPKRLTEKALTEAKKGVWLHILDKTKAPSFMTRKRYENFQKAMEKPDELPEITHESIKAFVDMIINTAPDMILEFVTETFEWLLPRYWSVKGYKTNQKAKYELQEKIIHTCGIGLAWGGGFSIRYDDENRWDAMGNAFSLLDGKGIKKHPDNLSTAIKTALQDKECQVFENEYFQLKFYRNQNCHIKFKRMDLVRKMNQVAGDHRLKQEAA